MDEALRTGLNAREGVWSENSAVGGGTFVEAVKAELEGSGRYRRIHSGDDDIHGLKELAAGYQVDFDAKKTGLS